jgi:hypothetical protein
MKLQPKVYIVDVKLEETKTLNFSHPEQVHYLWHLVLTTLILIKML